LKAGFLLDLMYPPACALCGAEGSACCESCRLEMESEPGRDFEPPAGSPLAGVRTVWAYQGRAGQAVRRLKYERATALAGPLSQALAEAWTRFGLAAMDAALPIPIHWRRRARRGFNQAELLCEGLPEDAVRTDLLKRIRATRPQVELGRAERLRSLRGAFAAAPEARGMRLLLIDDVCTSGGTMIAAAEALAQAGAREVWGLALCGGAEPGAPDEEEVSMPPGG
jgi:ComF family protein